MLDMYRVSKKMSFIGKTALTTYLQNHQNVKVWGVLENSGYLLHHGHWDFQNWRRNDWENEASLMLPLKRADEKCVKCGDVEIVTNHSLTVFPVQSRCILFYTLCGLMFDVYCFNSKTCYLEFRHTYYYCIIRSVIMGWTFIIGVGPLILFYLFQM